MGRWHMFNLGPVAPGATISPLMRSDPLPFVEELDRARGDAGIHLLADQRILRYSQTVCDGLRDDDDGVRREVLAHAGNRWSLGVIHTLGVYGQLRHAEIGRRMHGITQRMLTRTLRHLERDGLVIRHDFDEIVPHVEYSLSGTGLELLVRLVPLWTWIVGIFYSFRAPRETFDRHHPVEEAI